MKHRLFDDRFDVRQMLGLCFLALHLLRFQAFLRLRRLPLRIGNHDRRGSWSGSPCTALFDDRRVSALDVVRLRVVRVGDVIEAGLRGSVWPANPHLQGVTDGHGVEKPILREIAVQNANDLTLRIDLDLEIDMQWLVGQFGNRKGLRFRLDCSVRNCGSEQEHRGKRAGTQKQIHAIPVTPAHRRPLPGPSKAATMFRLSRFVVLGLLAAFVGAGIPAFAARPIVDTHKLDAYFALYAHDADVPWKTTAVRLDTYTSAPLHFSVYQVDPAQVLVAGANTRPRAIDTRRLRPLARWRYVPPGGYRFQTNDVDVPLQQRQGFFVVEARRGNVGEQVWIDRTRIGLLTKETPDGILLYATDLGSGKPLAHARVSFIVNRHFVYRYTDGKGLLRWTSFPRPIFALAQWGSSTAFVSFLPQPPLASTVVALKTNAAVVHAGGIVDVVGFARARAGSSLKPARGRAQIVLRSAEREIARQTASLDAAGAFAARLRVPAVAAAGQYTVLASVNGSTAGTQIHVDADAGALSLDLVPQCDPCAPDRDVPVEVRAERNAVPAANVDVRVQVIRSPHVDARQTTAQPWGMARWYRTTVRTNALGQAVFQIPRPSDGLASTYGVRAASGGATAVTRIIVPTGPIAVRVTVENADIGSGTPAAFNVDAFFAATGKPCPDIPVRVQLVHGTSIAQQTVTLGADGRAHGAFTSPQVGSNLVLASIDADGAAALDAAQIQVEPQTMLMRSTQRDVHIHIALNRTTYRPGQPVHVDARLPGAQGDAVLTLESATGTAVRVVPIHDGTANTTFKATDGVGLLAIGAAFVRAGAVQWSTIPIQIDAPGRPQAAVLHLDRSGYAPGGMAQLSIGGHAGRGTLVVRVTKGAPTGSASFRNAPGMLAVGTTTTQDSAADGTAWHPWVDSTGSHPVIQTFERRTAPPADLTMTDADPQSVYWSIGQSSADVVRVPVPQKAGRYTVSVLKIGDDGRVSAGHGELVVQ